MCYTIIWGMALKSKKEPKPDIFDIARLLASSNSNCGCPMWYYLWYSFFYSMYTFFHILHGPFDELLLHNRDEIKLLSTAKQQITLVSIFCTFIYYAFFLTLTSFCLNEVANTWINFTCPLPAADYVSKIHAEWAKQTIARHSTGFLFIYVLVCLFFVWIVSDIHA